MATPSLHPLPKPLPGFEHINRYWDARMHVPAAKILPGELYVSEHGEMIVTVLGSCIAACIRDKVIGVGGMNHFMLPVQTEFSGSWGAAIENAAFRYGNWAMEFLINEILKRGGRREHLEVKLFGGGAVLNNMTDIGRRNIEFVREYLVRDKLTIAAEDLGGVYPRKVLYFSDTGAVKLRKLRHTRNETLAERERQYLKSLEQQPQAGDVELF